MSVGAQMAIVVSWRVRKMIWWPMAGDDVSSSSQERKEQKRPG